jgi:hypothetical protein
MTCGAVSVRHRGRLSLRPVGRVVQPAATARPPCGRPIPAAMVPRRVLPSRRACGVARWARGRRPGCGTNAEQYVEPVAVQQWPVSAHRRLARAAADAPERGGGLGREVRDRSRERDERTRSRGDRTTTATVICTTNR